MNIQEALEAANVKAKEGAIVSDIEKSLVIPGLSIQVHVSPEDAANWAGNVAYGMVLQMWFFVGNAIGAVSGCVQSAKKQIEGKISNGYRYVDVQVNEAKFVIGTKLKMMFVDLWSRYVLDNVAVVFWTGYEFLKPVYQFAFVLEGRE
jgi:hypothetical protein